MFGEKNEQTTFVQTTVNSGLQFRAKPKCPISFQYPHEHLAPCRPLPFFLNNPSFSWSLADESLVYVPNPGEDGSGRREEKKLGWRNN